MILRDAGMPPEEAWMADNRNIDAKALSIVPRRDTSNPASRAVSANPPEPTRELDSELLGDLTKAALCPERPLSSGFVRKARASGVTAEDIADYYIPRVARDLGEAWCNDEIGFASVTIGASRLQCLLREMGTAWSGEISGDPAGQSILLVVPPDAHHTLGALVVSGQLRRLGLSVRLLVGGRQEDIVGCLGKCRYDAIFVSAAQSQSLESLRRIVNIIRSATEKAVPVVIGGALLECEDNRNLVAQTGADHATQRLDDALKYCGLTTAPRNDASLTRRN